jgi:hypothetical protein
MAAAKRFLVLDGAVLEGGGRHAGCDWPRLPNGALDRSKRCLVAGQKLGTVVKGVGLMGFR